MFYSSERTFRMWAYTVSHSTLLLRSPLVFPDQDGYAENLNHNIDIEFSDVMYMELQDTIHRPEIRTISKDLPEKLKKFHRRGQKIFQLRTVSDIYYIVAGSCVISRNQWFNTDRISNFKLVHDEVLKVL